MARRTKPSKARGRKSTPPTLRRLDEAFAERRFEPQTGQREVVGVVALSLGGIALGVGVYALAIRDAALMSLSYPPYVLAVGVVLIAYYFLFGKRGLQTLRVGELGVGLESDGRVSRTGWYEVESIDLASGQLQLATGGRLIRIPLEDHGAAVRRLVSEARTRIPKRVALDEEDLVRIGEPAPTEGQPVDGEPPQVTQESCLASDRPLSVEEDVRMCRRCGALYHRSAVPRRCLGCGK
ncbi:MAG: hypothetical protein JRI68_33690, partial [Deltaproteobacteria bacterium]|nr:hypothetical protein [Deltaproteobacteria bacterium]